MSQIQEADVVRVLRNVQDPDLHRDIVSLGFVKKVDIDGGKVSVVVELTTPACPVKEQLRGECERWIRTIDGVTDVHVEMTAQVRGKAAQSSGPVLPGVKNVLAVASGKGGVGKSTVAVNLAAALADAGASVGLLDADVYGPSVAHMVGGEGQPKQNPQGMLVPFDAHGMKFMSMGMLVGDQSPVVWRGPMASSLIQQFLTKVDWGEIDYLVVDLPPGTGDVQLTLTQTAELTGAIIVTTPQDVASEVAQKGLKMFGTVNVPVLGVVENMAYFKCGHCDARHEIFRPRGGDKPFASWGVPVLGAIPIEPELAALGDEGTPVVKAAPDSDTAAAFRALAETVASGLSTITMTQAGAGMPTAIDADGPLLQVTWDDGHVSRHNFQRLRFLCSCAGCVDEHTGKRKTVLEFIDPNVRPMKIEQSGRYALQFTWSDNHDTGLYTFPRLRDLCECESCAAKEKQSAESSRDAAQ
ncbi:MAG: P-loop NTPase [Planctomycetota bacterium JB042]